MKFMMFFLFSIVTATSFAQSNGEPKKFTELEKAQNRVKAGINATTASGIFTVLTFHGSLQKGAEVQELIKSRDAKVALGEIEHLAESDIKIGKTVLAKNRLLGASGLFALLTTYLGYQTVIDYNVEKELKAKDVSFIDGTERKIQAKIVTVADNKRFNCEEQ